MEKIPVSVHHLSFKVGKKSKRLNQYPFQTSAKTIKLKPPIVLRNARANKNTAKRRNLFITTTSHQSEGSPSPLRSASVSKVIRDKLKLQYSKIFDKILNEEKQKRIEYETKQAKEITDKYNTEMKYTDRNKVYSEVLVDKLIGDFVDTQETDCNDKIVKNFRESILNSVNVGEVSSKNRLEAKILKKAVEEILEKPEGETNIKSSIFNSFSKGSPILQIQSKEHRSSSLKNCRSIEIDNNSKINASNKSIQNYSIESEDNEKDFLITEVK